VRAGARVFGNITPATKIRTNPYSRFGPATADRGSRGIRDQPRNPPKYTEKRIRINFPFPCPSRGRAHARREGSPARRVGSFRSCADASIFPCASKGRGPLESIHCEDKRTRASMGSQPSNSRTPVNCEHHQAALPGPSEFLAPVIERVFQSAYSLPQGKRALQGDRAPAPIQP